MPSTDSVPVTYLVCSRDLLPRFSSLSSVLTFQITMESTQDIEDPLTYPADSIALIAEYLRDAIVTLLSRLRYLSIISTLQRQL